MTLTRLDLLAAALLFTTLASPAATLCKPGERVVFACTASPKQLAVCATGDLHQPEGRLIYRCGRDAAHIELEHGASQPPRAAGYRWAYQPWAKGETTILAFSRGEHGYTLDHSHGAFGVDGGDHFAELRVSRGEQALATIRCHEPSTVNALYGELNKLQLPSP